MPAARALTELYARVPFGMRLGLETMRRACDRAGNPERALRTVVHVAGTNGKGSVCAMVESIARAAGRRTGLYTSPHLCRFAERIRIQGDPLDDDALAAALGRALATDPELSFFEVATLAALLAFRDAAVDVAILEVGLGGRLDATNVVARPSAAAITRIALDHTDRLGSTLPEIAREKAGIAKPGLEILLGPMPPDVRAAIDEVASRAGATTHAVDGADGGAPVPIPERIALAGEHQKENARLAAALGERIGASRAEIDEGVAQTRWPGRLERIGPYLLDAAHNPDGAEALARHVRALGVPPGDAVLVFGALADKEWPAMLDVLAPLAGRRLYVSPQGGARPGAPPAGLAARHPGAALGSVADALSSLGANPPASLVVVAGSIGVVGEARARLLGLARDPPVAL